MEPLIFPLDERLANPGDTWPVTGHLDESGYELGDHEFSLPEGIDYDVVLTNAGEGILATGLLRAHVVGTCDRCLEDAEFDVAGEVDGYYLFEEPEQLGEDEDEADYELVSADHTIDLSGALIAGDIGGKGNVSSNTVLISNASVGGNVSGGRVKNHYPKALRNLG